MRWIAWAITDRVVFADFARDFLHGFAAFVQIRWKVRRRSRHLSELLEFVSRFARRSNLDLIVGVHAYGIDKRFTFFNPVHGEFLLRLRLALGIAHDNVSASDTI